ncbi:proteinrelated to small s protein [Beauveria brongniartii RCEF 3172]|uniref:Proteinrelated to small s protein n=1 Tax=Beauveria brongniartii RCEF 3172 TaxID=1081107 RepID=A0A166ZTD7_9HYPO|nr:proteinrelated to small s protein [Beauveria brongniartii RCEF 3172]
MDAATPILPGSGAAAVLAFLEAATAVFAAAWSEQQRSLDNYDDVADDDLEKKKLASCWSINQQGGRLREALAVVAAVDETHGAGVSVGLLRACVKIGRDVVLRLDRREKAAERAWTWSLVDLAVLGERLDDLVQRARDFEQSDFTADQLRNLEQQLSVRLSPDAPSTDEYFNGEHAPETKPKAQEPLTELEGTPKGLYQHGQQPRWVSPDILNDFILEGLAYKSMHDREEEVAEAHATTFDWVFSDKPSVRDGGDRASKHSLKNWLSTAESGPIYWITGKPGSGKSTFMRYLFQNAATTRCLEAWSGGDRPLLVAGFFFWTSGPREQRSQSGLLRSLLHQLFSAHPDYIAASVPALWAKLRTMPTKERIRVRLEWTAEELLSALLAFIEAVAAAEKMKICLFVDGMDEFEGNHAMIIHLFRSLATGKRAENVKMCLSSRPWAVFRDAFEFAVPNLKLQELTYGDMRQYVSETLARSGDVNYILQQDTDKGSQFVDALIDRADGVFLWLRLAVERVLERFAREEGMQGLRDILEALPADLDELFAKLLFQDQTAQELEQSAALYSLMRAREEVADFVRNDDANSLTVWELAFALDKQDDELILGRVAVKEATDDYIAQRSEATIAVIKERFSGMLNLHMRKRKRTGNFGISHRSSSSTENTARDRARSRIVYSHRTVRDWLVSCPGVHDHLIQRRPAGFDPDLRLLRSYVLQMRRPLGRFERHRVLDDWWPDITLALTHARRIRADPDRLQRGFVNALDSVVARYWLRKRGDPYDHWARSAYGSFEARGKAPPIWQPFLGLAVKFGLRRYVVEELAARVRQQDEGEEGGGGISDAMKKLQVDEAVPLLAYATEYLCSRKKTIFPLSDPALVEDLLLLRTTACCVNPGSNHVYQDFFTRTDTTPWLAVLRHLRDARRRRWIRLYDVDAEGTRRWVKIVRLFLEVGGAEPEALVVADAWDPEITAKGVLELLDDTYGDAEIRALRDLLRGLAAEE